MAVNLTQRLIDFFIKPSLVILGLGGGVALGLLKHKTKRGIGIDIYFKRREIIKHCLLK